MIRLHASHKYQVSLGNRNNVRGIIFQGLHIFAAKGAVQQVHALMMCKKKRRGWWWWWGARGKGKKTQYCHVEQTRRRLLKISQRNFVCAETAISKSLGRISFFFLFPSPPHPPPPPPSFSLSPLLMVPSAKFKAQPFNLEVGNKEKLQRCDLEESKPEELRCNNLANSSIRLCLSVSATLMGNLKSYHRTHSTIVQIGVHRQVHISHLSSAVSHQSQTQTIICFWYLVSKNFIFVRHLSTP